MSTIFAQGRRGNSNKLRLSMKLGDIECTRIRHGTTQTMLNTRDNISHRPLVSHMPLSAFYITGACTAGSHATIPLYPLTITISRNLTRSFICASQHTAKHNSTCTGSKSLSNITRCFQTAIRHSTSIPNITLHHTPHSPILLSHSYTIL